MTAASVPAAGRPGPAPRLHPPIPCCYRLPGRWPCQQPAGHDPLHQADDRRRHADGRCGLEHLADDGCGRAAAYRRQRAGTP
jgi:hypothetical protein